MALSPDMLKEHFEQVQKCKVDGVISKIQDGNEDACSKEALIFINGKNHSYYMNGTFPKEGCIIDTYNKLFFVNDIKIGNNVEYYLDNNYRALDYYPGSVDTYNIPYCTGNIIQETTKEVSQDPSAQIKQHSDYYELLGIIFVILIIGGLVILKKGRKKS